MANPLCRHMTTVLRPNRRPASRAERIEAFRSFHFRGAAMKSMRFGRRGVLKGATATAALMGAARASFPAGAVPQDPGPGTQHGALGLSRPTHAPAATHAHEQKN